MRTLLVLTGVLVALPLYARAQATTAPANRPLPIITREDLAMAYIRAERAVRDHPPRDARTRAAAHRAMDRAAYQFFTADHSGAIRTMNELADALRLGREINADAGQLPHPTTEPARPPDVRGLVNAIRVRVAPRVANIHRPSIFNVRLSSLYPVAIDEPIDLRLVVREDKPEGKIVFEQALQLRGDAALPSVSAKQPDVKPGRYRVLLIDKAGEEIDVARWFVVDRSLDAQRAANERRLFEVKQENFKQFQALIACRGRNALLTDRPPELESSQFLADPTMLLPEVSAEVEALLKGEDPYAGRLGDYWRAIPCGAMQVPSRVYVPKQANAGQPMPLVIILHGAGGDENAWFDATGAGAIQRLADQHGFIVVSPNTYWVMPNPNGLRGIVEAMSVDYAIDPARIYVIGHSLGAMAAAGMATRAPDGLAGAVLIAGGTIPPKSAICPTLLVGAELDPLFPPHKLDGAAAEAKQAGLPVEFKLMRESGHVLVAGEVLPEAVEWLLKRQLAKKE
jgi:predicted esterase